MVLPATSSPTNTLKWNPLAKLFMKEAQQTSSGANLTLDVKEFKMQTTPPHPGRNMYLTQPAVEAILM